MSTYTLPPTAPSRNDTAAWNAYVAADSSGPLVASAIALQILTFIFVGLRIVSRRMARLKLGADDILIIIAAIFSIAFCVWAVLGAHYAFGHHTATRPQYATSLTKLRFSFSIFFVSTLAITKVSILLMLSRVFPVDKATLRLRRMNGYSIAWWSLFALNISWGLAFFWVFVISCSPPQVLVGGAVDPNHPPTCIKYETTLHFYGATAIALDLGILALPLHSISKLRLVLFQKITLIGIFGLGMFVTVATAVRWRQTWGVLSPRSVDPYWDAVSAYRWTTFEAYLAIIGACLPVMGPIAIFMLGPKSTRGLSSDDSLGSRSGSLKQARFLGFFRKAGKGSQTSSETIPTECTDDTAVDVSKKREKYSESEKPGRKDLIDSRSEMDDAIGRRYA